MEMETLTVRTDDLPDLPGERVVRDYMWRGRTRVTYSLDEPRSVWVVRGNGTKCGEGSSLIHALADAADNFGALAEYWLAEAAGDVVERDVE